VEARSPIPWLHIARVVVAEAVERDYSRLGVLGTRYLMEGPVYAEAAGPASLSIGVPEAVDRERVNEVIFRELVNAVFRPESRQYFQEVIRRLGERGAEAVVLGCTEIPLLIDEDTSPLPVLDSTRLLARAALRRALAGG
jgi:aspartate racemase